MTLPQPSSTNNPYTTPNQKGPVAKRKINPTDIPFIHKNGYLQTFHERRYQEQKVMKGYCISYQIFHQILINLDRKLTDRYLNKRYIQTQKVLIDLYDIIPSFSEEDVKLEMFNDLSTGAVINIYLTVVMDFLVDTLIDAKFEGVSYNIDDVRFRIAPVHGNYELHEDAVIAINI